MKINQGFVFILLGICSVFLPVDDYNMMPYFLIGVGIARLNNSWETKKKRGK